MTIIAAAVIIDGKVRSLPAPARHHHILHEWPMPEHHHGEQGFIDDECGFIDRKQAFIIAKFLGQLEGREKTGQKDMLFSEDLW